MASVGGNSQTEGGWEIIGDGQGIHWPDVDEDISLEGMLRGIPAKRPRDSAGRGSNQRKGVVA